MKPNKQLYEDIEDGEGFSFMITDSPFAKKSFEPKQKLIRLTIRQVIFHTLLYLSISSNNRFFFFDS